MMILSLSNHRRSLGLTKATFDGTYASLTAEGMISIKVRIAVTPGAALYLERRWAGVCEKVLTLKTYSTTKSLFGRDRNGSTIGPLGAGTVDQALFQAKCKFQRIRGIDERRI